MFFIKNKTKKYTEAIVSSGLEHLQEYFKNTPSKSFE